MSSTITALTSGGGLAMAGDTSGQLELKTNNGTTAVTIDTAQNVGIGVTPPASTFKSVFLGNSTNLGSLSQDVGYNDFAVGSNCYFDTTWKYSKTGEAAALLRAYGYDGQFFFQRAASGTAGGTISFTQVMAIDASANLKFNSGYGSAATAYGCRAWVCWDGSTGSGNTIRGSGNVSSITRTTTGRFTVSFTNAMPDANYAMVCSGGSGGVSSGMGYMYSPATGSCGAEFVNANDALMNPVFATAAVFR
jgi:hypothetical protein